MKRTIAAFIAVLMVLAGIAIAAGAPGGAQTTVVSSSRGTGTASQTADLTGGNVTAVNITGQQITGRWGGFYGNISGGIQLADASSNLFYQWTVTNYTGAYVYAANATVTNWTLSAATKSDQPAYIVGAAADNWSNTFKTTAAFQSASIGPVAATPIAYTLNSTGGNAFTTYSLYSSGDHAYIYAGKAINNAKGFNGQTVDYQILAPANSGLVSYQFYLELP